MIDFFVFFGMCVLPIVTAAPAHSCRPPPRLAGCGRCRRLNGPGINSRQTPRQRTQSRIRYSHGWTERTAMRSRVRFPAWGQMVSIAQQQSLLFRFLGVSSGMSAPSAPPPDRRAAGDPEVTPAEYMDRLLGGAKLSTRPGPHAGGEWDAWNALAPRVKKQIIGVGWAGPVGWAPDQLCAILGDRWTPDELIEQMARAARSIPEWRTQRETASRRQLAARAGHSSHYHHRQQQARNAGHRSLWAYRRARGWGHQ